MAKHSLICILITFLITNFPKFSLATPTVIYNICSNTTMFATKSRYETNLNTLFGYLSLNGTNPSGYHAAIAGNGTNDVVYGHFLCRGDQIPRDCNECVDRATSIDLPKTYCPNRKLAIIWYDECMVRYSNESFFGMFNPNYSLQMWNTHNVTVIYNITEFMDIMGNMMRSTVTRAANGGPTKKYATNFSSLEGIYGLEQCTPDLSSNDCNMCLVSAINLLPISKGGRVIGPSCNVRFETTPFFNGAENLAMPPSPPPPPPPPPSPPPPRRNSTGLVPVITPSNGKSKTSTKVIAIIVPVVVLATLLLVVTFFFIVKNTKKNDDAVDETDEDYTTLDSLQYDLASLRLATSNFSNENKIGEGGFGSVYKGKLSNGEDIAVKRLSKGSGQGAREFKNELVLVAQLQHRNLARVLGFCLDGNEKMLVYEYVPNKSLDNFLFDPVKQEQLNWGMRYNIIQGIARGISYLHHDSRLRVIHRDLKASNILLDANMNPKISDFGMARMFAGDQSQSNTSRVVGTFGYMPPEYVMHGHYSMKSDVYSFGVLVLEIVSGKRNNSFYESGYAEGVVNYAWKLWEEGNPLLFLDPTIKDSCSSHEVIRCVHLGLQCVQESVEARPTIESVVLSLDSHSVTLALPRQPAFFSKTRGVANIEEIVLLQSSDTDSSRYSVNDVTVSEVGHR